jgi:hypothetical protein
MEVFDAMGGGQHGGYLALREAEEEKSGRK